MVRISETKTRAVVVTHRREGPGDVAVIECHREEERVEEFSVARWRYRCEGNRTISIIITRLLVV